MMSPHFAANTGLHTFGYKVLLSAQFGLPPKSGHDINVVLPQKERQNKMKKSRFSAEQIIAILREVKAGGRCAGCAPSTTLGSKPTYGWKRKYAIQDWLQKRL